MAAAEARAAWQRAANRCFVQEDAKRAPKLACSQSSTSSPCKQADAGTAGACDGSDNPGLGFIIPFNLNPSYCNLPPDARWWLQLDLSYDHQMGFNRGHLKAVKADVEPTQVGNMNSSHRVAGSNILDEEMEPSCILNTTVSKEHDQVRVEGMGVMKCKIDRDALDVKDLTDYYELMEMELVGGSTSKPSSGLSYYDSNWIEGDELPWWRKTVQDWGQSCATSSLYSQASPDARNKRSERTSIDRGLSGSLASGHMSVNSNESIDKPRHPGDDAARAQLLEALCHSQTRAREAEKAAKQAYTEKEHIVKLFFKQASLLFAYKQWFRLLQLEYYLRNNSNPPPSYSTLFPDGVMPWSSCKPHKIWKKTEKAKRRKLGLPRCEICKYAVAFALGLSLVGAGLLLGWTAAWLLPSF